MRSLRAMLRRFRGLFRRNELESGMQAEMQAHLDVLTERNLAAGPSPDEARHAALREFGGMAQFAEQACDERRSLWGEELAQDLRYAITVALEKSAHEWVAEKGYDPIFGARPLKRFLQRNNETKLARGLISGEIAEGSVVNFHVKNDELTFEKLQPAVAVADQKTSRVKFATIGNAASTQCHAGLSPECAGRVSRCGERAGQHPRLSASMPEIFCSAKAPATTLSAGFLP